MSGHAPEEIAKALDLSKKIEAKAHDLLEPLVREMQIMGWRPEYCAIMWEVIARKALQRARDASGA